jgi:hypothetical protein
MAWLAIFVVYDDRRPGRNGATACYAGTEKWAEEPVDPLIQETR